MAQGNAPRLRRREPRRYIGTDMLKIIGLLLTVQGTVGVALLQNGLLNMGGQTRLELWDLIQTDQNAAQVLAWSVLSKGMVSLAWPIFAYLAVEGLQNTSSFPRYALRLLITALVSEVPYDLAMSGKWVDWSSQNFLFSLLIGLVALYMVQEVAEARENGRALQVLFPVGAVLWTFLFQTQLGILVVLAMTAMYFLRGAPPVAGHSGGRPGPCHHPRLPQRPADPLPPPGTQHVPPSGSITPPTPSSSWSSASLAISFCRLSISFLVCCKIASLICEREKTQISVSSPAVFHFEGGCCQNDIPIFLSIAPDGAHTKGWPYSSGVSSSVGSSGKSSSAGVSRVVPPAASSSVGVSSGGSSGHSSSVGVSRFLRLAFFRWRFRLLRGVVRSGPSHSERASASWRLLEVWKTLSNPGSSPETVPLVAKTA